MIKKIENVQKHISHFIHCENFINGGQALLVHKREKNMTSGLDFLSHLSVGRKKSLHITAVIRSMDQAKFDGMAAKERVGANLGFRAPNRMYGRMKRSTLVSTAPPWKLPRAGHFSAIPLGKGFSLWRTKKIQMFNHMADVRFEPAYHH